MELTTVPIDKPDALNIILGQMHFIKTVEDLHEVLVNAAPGIRVPNSANAGQTRTIRVGLASKHYDEKVAVQLLKSNPSDPWNPWVTVGTLTQSVPVRPSNRTTDFNFSYTFTLDDAWIGKVSFKAVVTLLTGRDPLPADNEAIAPPTKVGGKTRTLDGSATESTEQRIQIFLPVIVSE